MLKIVSKFKQFIKMIQQHPAAISLDWLSIYCHGTIENTINYTFKLLDFHTRQFTEVYEVYFKNKKIATATAKPASKILAPNSIIIKFENALLYTAALKHFVFKFLTETNIKFKSITRADIAKDFHRFDTQEHPQQFIRKFFSGEYLKNGRGQFQAIGEQKDKTIYEYLKFGSRLTGRHIYLYNKTKELNDVKEKHHIRDFWKLNNLNTGPDVWRIEFSFKGAKNKILDTLSGCLDKIKLNDLFSFEMLQAILNTAISQLFSFKVNDNLKNKTRMPDLELFHDVNKSRKLVSIPDKSDTTRSQRILLKAMLEELNQTIKTDPTRAFFIQQTLQIIAGKYNLSKYLSNKLGYVYQPILYSNF